MAQTAPLNNALDVFLEEVTKGVTERLIARGCVVQLPLQSPIALVGDYDNAACLVLVDPQHMGDNVLERSAVFFGEAAQHGEISSIDLAAKLNLKGATSISAALTNTLKKGARRLGLGVPWTEASTSNGSRTLWNLPRRDRGADGHGHRGRAPPPRAPALAGGLNPAKGGGRCLPLRRRAPTRPRTSVYSSRLRP